MSKNKLQNLFDCLELEEKKQFPGWLKLELRGRSKDVWQWFEQMWENKTDAEAWEIIYSSKPLDQSKINSMNTRLIKWVEEYLAICTFRKDTFAQILYLNRAIIRRNPMNVYPSSIRKSRKLLEQQPIRDKTYYQIQHELDRFDREFRSSYPGIQIRRYNPTKEQTRENEKMALLLGNIEIAVRRNDESNRLTEWDQYCISQLQTYIDTDSPKKWPVAYLYMELFKCLQPQKIMSDEEAKQLVEFYQDHFLTLRPDAQSIVGILIQNCLIKSFFRQEEKSIIDLVFELNIWMLNRSQIYGARYFYRNMVQIPAVLAQRSEDSLEKEHFLQLAQRYLEELKEKLPADEREEAYLFNLADLHFEAGNFAELTKQIYALKFKDYAYEVHYLILWNKAQYELGRLEGLTDRLKNLQASLQQSRKLRPELKKRQLSMVKYFRKIVTNYSPTILKRLKKELEKEDRISDRKWLIMKLDQKINLQSRK